MITPDLHNLLYQCSNNPDDHTVKLITADMAEECGFRSLANIIRYLGRHRVTHIFTGSRYYGTPTDESDWDWVVRTNGRNGPTTEELTELADPKPKNKKRRRLHRDYDYEVDPKITRALRFGPLNLICCSTLEQWYTWDNGTERCKLLSPISTDRATEIIDDEYALQTAYRDETPEDYE